FGHEKGSFTGAMYQHIGKFEKSHGGSLFLDEIGDMDMALQAKLLRVLQTGEFERVGGNRVIKVDVRIISATNKNLYEEVAAQRFREDLFYRLNVISIELPALRERKDDISLLTDFFIRRYCQKYEKDLKKLKPEAMTKLENYQFPGNVRELENIINRAVVVSQSDVILAGDINLSPGQSLSLDAVKGSFAELVNQLFEKILELPEENRREVFPIIEETLIRKALEKEKGNQVRASNLLGISRNTLRNRMERFGL
ncbi:MAG: sigma-54 dependent transcriptional regulator, partial [Spirochaetota bacterium]|nr:sigma-54 dependent transcriptional regulator [Spirochaetota bacterium]